MYNYAQTNTITSTKRPHPMQSSYKLIDKMIDKQTNNIPIEFENTIEAGRFSEFMSQKSTIKLAIEFYNKLGRHHYNLQRYDKAMAAFENIIALDPNHYHAYNNCAIIHLERKHYSKSIAMLTHSINITPNSTAYYKLAHIHRYGMNDIKTAIKNCEQATKLNPRHAKANVLLADMYHMEKQWELAVAAYRHSIALCPNHYLLFRNCGKAHENLGMLTEAIVVYTEALRRNPKSVSTLNFLNTLLYSINNNHDLSALDKNDLFNAITKLPEKNQLPLLEKCKDKNTPFGIIMHKPRNSLVNIITFFDSNPNDYSFIKCDKSKGMLKKIDEQIYAIKQKLQISDSEEECWTDENSEEEIMVMKSRKI